MNKILFAGFDGIDNPARELVGAVTAPCRRVVLPNDKTASAELLKAETAHFQPDIVLMTGQKPAIKDKVSVELCAKSSGETLTTALDCKTVRDFILSRGYACYISKNCGTSYCNHIYAECLRVFPRGLFIHIPFKKNITDFAKLKNVLEQLVTALNQHIFTI